MIQDSESYREWVLDAIERDGRLVLEREMYEQSDPNTLISVVRHNTGKYSIYRTFDLGGTVATSVDTQDVSAEQVFASLFDRYSRRLT